MSVKHYLLRSIQEAIEPVQSKIRHTSRSLFPDVDCGTSASFFIWGAAVASGTFFFFRASLGVIGFLTFGSAATIFLTFGSAVVFEDLVIYFVSGAALILVSLVAVLVALGIRYFNK